MLSQRVFLKMATRKGVGRPRKSSKQTPLEASLEHLHSVGSSLEKKNPPKQTNFFLSYDGSGKRVPLSKPYKYRSVAERASKKSRGESTQSSHSDWDSLGETGDMAESDCDMTGLEETSTYATSTESLSNCIKTCEQIAEEITCNSQSTWTRRMQSVEANWESNRESLFSALLKSYMVPSQDAICFFCNKKNAVIRCHQCGPRVLMCSNCDEGVHKEKPLHDRDVWMNGFFQEISPTDVVLEDGSLGFVKRCAPFLLCKQCVHCKEQGTLKLVPSNETCIVITCGGRYDLFLSSYYCNNCEEQFSLASLETIISEGYWPGNPKQFNHVFSQDVFKLWDYVRKHMPGTSETAFLRSLGNISSEKGRSATINVTVFHRAFKEWCFAMYEIESLQGKKWIDCPSCYGCQHSCHVDGNAKLYRYSCVPRGERKCYYGNLFIEEKDVVDAHLKNVYTSAAAKKKSGNSYCGTSNWKAARNNANSRAKLDETGLEVAGCRHAFALAAVNMYQGELFGYAHYLQINRLLPQGVKFMWQDVICKYWPWFISLPKELSPPEAFLMKPALSIMHGKAHIWSCQVTWGGRWQHGSAYTAGEEVEQINSYISRLGSTTKYMNAAGRDESLTEHILFWNKQKLLKLHKSLSKRYVDVKKLIEANKEELKKEMQEIDCGNQLENGILDKWMEEIVRCGKRSQFGEVQPTKREHELMQYYQLSVQISEANSLKPFVEEARDGVGVTLVTGNGELFRQALSNQEDVERKEKQLEKLESSLDILACDDKRTEALEDGKRRLASQKRQRIREEIEMLSFSISQRVKNIGRLADSSKQRTKLRSKNMSENKKLEDLIKEANFVNKMLEETLSDITLSQALTGCFPWIDQEDNNAVLPLRAKRKAVEVFLTGKRLEEEVLLLEDEMRRFLCYYRDKVIPDLSSRLDSLDNDELPADDLPDCSVQLDEGKYKFNKFSRIAMAGERALLKSGIVFGKLMIKTGATFFKRVIDGTMDELEFSDNEGDDDEDEDGEEEFEEEYSEEAKQSNET